MEASTGVDNGSMTNKVFLTPEPVPLLESHGQSIIALVPNHVITSDVREMPASVQRHASELAGRTMLVRL